MNNQYSRRTSQKCYNPNIPIKPCFIGVFSAHNRRALPIRPLVDSRYMATVNPWHGRGFDRVLPCPMVEPRTK